MAEPLSWRFPISILSHLSTLIPPSDNPLSLLTFTDSTADVSRDFDSDIIREAGIKDTLGHLSPAFQKALAVLTDPEACVKIQASEQTGVFFNNSIFYSKSFSRSVSVSETDGDIQIIDPANYEEIIQQMNDIVGLCSKSSGNFKVILPVEEAIVFTALLDLLRKSKIQDILNNVKSDNLTFSTLSIIDHIAQNFDNLKWYVSSAQLFDKLDNDPSKISFIAQELSTKNLCIYTPDGLMLTEYSKSAASNNCLIDHCVSVQVKRFFRNSKRISKSHQRWLQSGVNDLLSFTYESANIQIEQTTSKLFVENLSFLLNGGVTQIPEPIPEPVTSEATIILGANEFIWQIIPKETGKPIRLTNIVKLGRNPDNQIIFNDPSVSRIHAQFDIKGNECWLSDLNSRNGTFVNNIRIKQPTRLQDKDLIKIGPFIFEIRVVASGTLPTQSLPIPET